MSTTVDVGHLAAVALARGAQQKHGELVAFAELAIHRGVRTLIELGTGAGATAWFFAQLGMCVWAVDARLPDTLKPENEVPGRLLFVHKLTVEYAARTQLVDAVLIDAGHSYNDASRDWDSYREKVRPGGLVAFHDIVRHSPQHDPMGQCEVWRLWEELRADPELHTEELVGPPMGWGGFGVVLV